MSNITRLIRHKTPRLYFDRLGKSLSIGSIVYCLRPVVASYLPVCYVSDFLGGLCEITSFSTNFRYVSKPYDLVQVDED